MGGRRGDLVVGVDTIIEGSILNCGRLEVLGRIDGEIGAALVVVRPGGQLYGKINAEDAEVEGTVQGELAVAQLLTIRKTASVGGNVRYGQLAVEAGGELSADVRNVPPSIGGDLRVAVGKGRSVPITLLDLTAFDPDDAKEDLVFTVSNARSGFVTRSDQPGKPLRSFTQAELAAGKVLFVHDGSTASSASFDVVVADKAGATSGGPHTVKVDVRGAA